jgi:hypothetical protein
MISVFLGGSRSITTIAPCIQPRLDAIVARGHTVVVGDAPGADSCLQRYLAKVQYRNVTVFYSGTRPRSNIGTWPTHAVPTGARPNTVAFHTAKDIAMAEAATCGLMAWDMCSSGTFANASMLLRSGKRLLVYLAPEDHAVTLRTMQDLQQILARCPSSIRDQLQRRERMVA